MDNVIGFMVLVVLVIIMGYLGSIAERLNHLGEILEKRNRQ